MQLNETVRPLRLSIVNAFLLSGSKGFVLVDAGMGGPEKTFLSALKDAGVEPKDISLVIATHTHRDHIGGVPKALALTGAKLLCTRKAADYLAAGKCAPVVARTFLGKIFSSLFPDTGTDPLAADIAFEDEIDLSPYGVAGKAVATPGHTDDSLSILLDSGLALVGDLFRGSGAKLSFGFAYQDGNACRESVRRILAAKPHEIFMSHGDTTTSEHVSAFLEAKK